MQQLKLRTQVLRLKQKVDLREALIVERLLFIHFLSHLEQEIGGLCKQDLTDKIDSFDIYITCP